MRAIYNFLQNGNIVVIFTILFGTCFNMPSYLQHHQGYDVAALYTWALLAVSISIFGFCFWWLKSDWNAAKPWYMVTLTAGSAMGLLISVSALWGMHGFGSSIYLYWRQVIPPFALAAMAVGLTVEWIRPVREK